MISKTLEQKTEKIDWKEWLPIYGIYQTIINQKETTPNRNNKIFKGYATYQIVSTVALSVVLYKLGEIIFK